MDRGGRAKPLYDNEDWGSQCAGRRVSDGGFPLYVATAPAVVLVGEQPCVIRQCHEAIVNNRPVDLGRTKQTWHWLQALTRFSIWKPVSIRVPCPPVPEVRLMISDIACWPIS